MAKTNRPTGLKINRKGNVFTLKWNKNDSDYSDGLQVKDNKGNVTKISTSKKDYGFTINPASYYPTTKKKIKSVSLSVRGNRKKYEKNGKKIDPGWSDWATKKFALKKLSKPQLTAELDSELTNKTLFSWDAGAADTGKKWFVDVLYESILIKGYNVSDPTQLAFDSGQYGWQTGTGTSQGSVAITEETEDIDEGSCTRWVRVCARGPQGPSEWNYASHTYSETNSAETGDVDSTEQPGGSGYIIRVDWEAPSDEATPIDKTIVQYAIEEPAAGLTCPAEANWSDGNISADTEEKDVANLYISGTLAKDKCIFVRVNTQHDGNITYGSPRLATIGMLKDPTLTSVQTNDETFRATVTATNNSEVADSVLVIMYMPGNDPAGAVAVGTIAHGQTSATVQCPDWSGESAIAFGVYALVEAGGRSMRSKTVWQGGTVPKAPTGVTAAATSVPGTVQVKWTWAWTDADSAQIAWADHEDAWESTDEPETFTIGNLRAARWNISGLETGQPWYIRVRLINTSGDNETYGPWSDTVKVDLASAPSVPSLILSDRVITTDGSVIASWAYSTTDGTLQAFAEVCDAVYDDEEGKWDYSDVIAHTTTAQHVTIDAKSSGWSAGETHYLCVRVTSASGRRSDAWSEPVAVKVATPLTATIASTSLQNVTVTEDGRTRTVLSLTAMPLTATITGAGSGGKTTLIIERADDYDLERPDESKFTGFEGETIAQMEQVGQTQITVTREDLIGPLDDEAPYRIVAIVQDDLGQTAQAELEFEVHWTAQALMPEAKARVDQDQFIAIIKPIAPAGAASGDRCDIYRLSADRPRLIVENAEFGVEYVDPYPTIGEMGGHRVVYRTVNGDYITADGELAWIDLREQEWDRFDTKYNIIDFEGERAQFEYEVDVTNTWNKDFERTEYLDGSVQGDWGKAVKRDGNIETLVTTKDPEQIRIFRMLADEPRICHVRTKDGSSYAADVQVKEAYKSAEGQKMARFSLTVSAVDPEDLDGMTMEEWVS